MNEAEIKQIAFDALLRVAPESDPAALDPRKNIREELDIDSYDFLQFLIAISEKTGVEIPEADYAKVFTLEGLLSYLSARIG